MTRSICQAYQPFFQPKQFYDFNLKRWSSFRDARPNIAHIALAELESQVLVFRNNQNIDGLHKKAGSKRVWEVHESFTHMSLYEMQVLVSL